MALVKVRFFDDEVMTGNARELDFDEPDFIVDVEDLGSVENNEMAWVPLSAVKWVEMPLGEIHEPETPTRKVAIRFLDGEVLRGHVDGQLSRHRYGLVLHLHPEINGSEESVRKLGIPFSAIKALFYVREFDGRHVDERGLASDAYLARRTMAPLLDVLEEMDMLERLHSGGVLSDQEFDSKRTQVLERM
jgi:uncharacterized protein DUF6982